MKALKYVGIALVVLVGAVFIALMTVDVGQYKGVIEEQAKAATGREVKIGGIGLAISLSPAIVVTDVQVANAPWGSRPQMATIKQVEAGTQLIPLIFGTINISGLKVADADVILEVNQDGKGNWEFDTGPSSGEPPALNVSGLDAKGLKLAYRDAKTGMSADVALEAATVKIADLMKLEITDIDLQKAKVSFSDKTQSAEADIGALTLEAAGPITALGITLVEASDAKAAFKLPAQNGDVSVGKLVLRAQGPLTDLGITALDGSDLAFTYDGDGAGAGAAMQGKFAALKVGAKGEVDINGELDGQKITAAGTLAPVADVVGLKKSFPAKLTFDALGIKGETDVTVDASGKVPALRGSITLPEIDLTKLAPAEAATAAPSPPGAKVFPADPLSWDQLSAAQADLSLSIGMLKLPNGLTLDNVKVPVVLNGGKLTANGLAASLAGGTVTADLGLDQGSKSLSLKADAKGFTAENLTKQFQVTDIITNGDMDVAIEVRGAGSSVAAIMAGLNGSVIGGMGESRIRNDALNVIGADVIMQLLSAINPFGNKDPYTVAKCAVINFQITNGIANTDNGVAMVTDKMQAVSTGKIDLAKEQVDLSIRPKATTGVSVGLGKLTQAVKLSGPLSSPGVAVDAAGAVKALGSIGAAFATGGASLLAEGVKEKVDTSGNDPCQTARTWHLAKK
ncbi:MAG: AsmA family protein [Rhodospirillaceae bacterium]|nr:AsmA family protein [Rhodospirillaceae bacterium]